MSATNHTTTIGLSQYISTDKPTYLTDYNGDMLAIDNAIASDRDGISTAQNKANTADGKADANKLSIDTLNAQINGDPTDPSDTGLAGKVTDNSGDIDTIEALIGNGTPTTSNQTIIGAINGLEGAIAPREDGDTLANSYSEGEQFARGGSVYTALTALTAGTAFASLTLNTDYENSDTLVEQISNNNSDIADISTFLNGKMIIAQSGMTIAEVTADGVKTYADMYHELALAVQDAAHNLADNERYEVFGLRESNFGDIMPRRILNFGNTLTDFSLIACLPYCDFVSASAYYIRNYKHTVSSTLANCKRQYVGMTTADAGVTVTMAQEDSTESVPTSGTKFSIYGNKLRRYN